MKKRLRRKMMKMQEGSIQIGEKEQRDTAVEALSEKVQEYEDLLKRLQADFQNYRKRSVRQHSQAGDLAKKKVLSKLLEIYDNMELALDKDDGSSPEVASFCEGLRLIHRRLGEILKDEGVVAIDAGGETFDPAVHEAVFVEETPEEAQVGRVARELRKGFTYKEWLLRPAKVVVYGRKKETEHGEDGAADEGSGR
jgi:molecular chaperone GrpE